LLTEFLLNRICAREGLPPKHLSREAQARLCESSWPGNVRQLENALEQAVAISQDRPLLLPSDFPLTSTPRETLTALPEIRLPPAGLDLDAVMTSIQKSLLSQALRRARGNKKRAADLLRIKRTTFGARWRGVNAAGLDDAAAGLGLSL
jgi:DNA-binding NtrC family response regulator